MKRRRKNGNGNGNGKYKRKDKGKSIFDDDPTQHPIVPQITLTEDESESTDEKANKRSGPPSKYLKDPNYYNTTVVFLMGEGMTKEAASLYMGITPFTLWHWRKKGNPAHALYDTSGAYEPFFKALRKGDVARQIWWEERGRKNLGNPQFNSTLWMMNMTNLFRKDKDILHGQGWARRTEETQVIKGKVKHDHDHKHTIDLDKLTKREAEHVQRLIHKASATTH